MEKITPAYRIFLILSALLLGCASTEDIFQLIKINSNSGSNIHSKRLGVLPLECYDPEVGNMISDSIGYTLKDSGIVILEREYIDQIFRDRGLDLEKEKDNLDSNTIGEICNVDYLLKGTVSVHKVIYSKKYVREGTVKYSYVTKTRLEIINVKTGEVILNAILDRPPKNLNRQPPKIGIALANAIKKELGIIK